MIIEDDVVVRDFLRETLEGAGFQVVEARNGQEGLAFYQRAPTDMVITDLVMPEVGGQEVIMELTWPPEAAKILAITGHDGDPHFLDVAETFGVRRTLRKPFKPRELLQAVQEVLQSGT